MIPCYFLFTEAGAALDAAALQDLTTGRGRVTLHKTMLTLGLALMGLISSFCSHNIYFPFLQILYIV